MLREVICKSRISGEGFCDVFIRNRHVYSGFLTASRNAKPLAKLFAVQFYKWWFFRLNGVLHKRAITRETVAEMEKSESLLLPTAIIISRYVILKRGPKINFVANPYFLHCIFNLFIFPVKELNFAIKKTPAFILYPQNEVWRGTKGVTKWIVGLPLSEM